MTTYARTFSNYGAGDPILYQYLDTEFTEIFTAIGTDGITAEQIATGTITASELATDSVEENQILDAAVTNDKLANNAVTSAKIEDGTIEAGDIANVSPAAYTGQESVTMSNSLIMKFGVKTSQGNQTIAFGEAFPTACISLVLTDLDPTGSGSSGGVNSNVRVLGAASVTVWINTAAAGGACWIALGY